MKASSSSLQTEKKEYGSIQRNKKITTEVKPTFKINYIVTNGKAKSTDPIPVVIPGLPILIDKIQESQTREASFTCKFLYMKPLVF